MYTPFPLLYDYDLDRKTKNYKKYGSHVATRTVSTHSVYSVPLLYDYDLEWKTKNYKTYESNVVTGTVYTHSEYSVPVTV